MQEQLTLFLAGATVMGFAIAGLFFLRFWVKSRDALFLAFAGAFWLIALQGFGSVLSFPKGSDSSLYLIRLAAFMLIIVAVAAKNRGRFGRRRR